MTMPDTDAFNHHSLFNKGLIVLFVLTDQSEQNAH